MTTMTAKRTIQEVVHRNLVRRLGGRSVRSVALEARLEGNQARYFAAPVNLSLSTLDRLARMLGTMPWALVDPSSDGQEASRSRRFDSTAALRKFAWKHRDGIEALEDRRTRVDLYEVLLERKKTHRLSFLALLCSSLGADPVVVLGGKPK